MKLFFETATQAQVFLAAVPLGMTLAAGVDLARLARRARPIADVLLLLLFGAALLAFLCVTKENGLRSYHLLALLLGYLLYAAGVGAVLKAAAHKIKRRKYKKDREQAGETH